uniref:Knottin scorpion toxin-like domain-containing protein n=1 Tax=Oryza punctata TaxID=4537 RepID=A0A0E0MDA0_ORYPU
MALHLAASSRNSTVAVAVPLVMFFLVAAAAAAASSSSSPLPPLPASSEYRPNDVDVFATCFKAESCWDTGCKIRCRDLGWNPACSRCKTFSRDVGQYCCCGYPDYKPPSS